MENRRQGRLQPISVILASFLCLLIANRSPAQVALDTGFGTGGIARFDFGGAYDDLSGLSVGSDGKIWAVGTGGTSNRFGVARLLSNGQFDNSFSGDGKYIVPNSAGSPAVLEQPDGQVLLGIPKLSQPRGFQAAKMNSNGTFDASFGNSGFGLIETPSQVYIEDMVLQADDKILIGGYDIFEGDLELRAHTFPGRWVA